MLTASRTRSVLLNTRRFSARAQSSHRCVYFFLLIQTAPSTSTTLNAHLTFFFSLARVTNSSTNRTHQVSFDPRIPFYPCRSALLTERFTWKLYAAFELLDQLSEEDKEILRRETTHRWHQPKTLYALVFLCSMAAAVQGVRSLPHSPF